MALARVMPSTTRSWISRHLALATGVEASLQRMTRARLRGTPAARRLARRRVKFSRARAVTFSVRPKERSKGAAGVAGAEAGAAEDFAAAGAAFFGAGDLGAGSGAAGLRAGGAGERGAGAVPLVRSARLSGRRPRAATWRRASWRPPASMTPSAMVPSVWSARYWKVAMRSARCRQWGRGIFTTETR